MKNSTSRKVFNVANYALMGLFALICLLPFVNLLATSLSSAQAVNAGEVTFLPVGFTFEAYKFLLQKPEFFKAFGMSVYRVILGTLISVTVCMLAAYALSRHDAIAGRKIYVIFFIITMFFSGGLVPTFLVVTSLGLYNTVWALVLPTATNAWNIVLFINFFRQVPHELEESAQLEGAGHFRTLFWVVLPVSLPALATVALLTVVSHWNAWFDGYIYMDSVRYPLQTYIYNIINQIQQYTKMNLSYEEMQAFKNLPDATLRSAQIFIAMLPIMLIYPFAQKFFVKGLMMGSVKE